MNLHHRVKQLEAVTSGATQSGDAIAERRARLAPYLADARYDGHREAILTALSEAPATPGGEALHYTFRQRHAPGEALTCAAFSLVSIDWAARDEGGAPAVVVFTLPEPEEAPADV